MATWSWNDGTSCEHNPDEACEPCLDADLYDTSITVLMDAEMAETARTPFGAGDWERDDGVAMCVASCGPNDDIEAELQACGIDAEER